MSKIKQSDEWSTTHLSGCMNTALRSGLALSLLLATACSTVPKVKIQYSLAATSVSAEVSRLLSCTKSQDRLVAVDRYSIDTVHTASLSAEDSYSLDLGRVSPWYAANDTTVEFYGDGRLKSLNTSADGQGEEIVDGALGLVGFTLNKATPGFRVDYSGICNYIDQNGMAVKDSPKQIEFKFFGNLRSTSMITPQETHLRLTPDPASERHMTQILSKICDTPPLSRECPAFFDKVIISPQYREIDSGVTSISGSNTKSQSECIRARQPRLALAEIHANSIGALTPDVDSVGDGGLTTSSGYEQSISVAHWGETYCIPTGHPRLFGKVTTVLSLAESGAVTKLQYATSGSAEASSNALDALLGTLEEKSAADLAAELKAEADVIAARQRLLRCQADPESCE